MKKITLTILSIFLFAGITYSQKPLTIELKDKKKQVLYLSLNDKNELEYVVSENDLDWKRNVNAKDNSINIYMKWLNPLKYKITWKDSTMTDERDKAITDFISSLVGQFGTQVSGLNQEAQNPKAQAPAGDIESRSFSNINLVVWLLHMQENQTELKKNPDDVLKINELSKKLEELDKLNSKDISKSATSIYSALFGISDITQYNSEFPKQNTAIADIEGDNGFAGIESLQKLIVAKLEQFKLTDKELLQTYTKAVVSNYIETVTDNLNSNKKIISKLKPVIEIVKNSTKYVSENTSAKEYYKIRSAEFDDGKKLETIMTITEYEFDKDTKEFKKKNDILTKTFQFRKYDIFDVSVSTGIFYGNTTLKGFGIENDGNNAFKVTEDIINKNTAVAAVFLNFNFKTSRYFSPLLQLGIDPTKKRPFMLAGVGFSIPVARIALSGGPIWTWNQTLDKLTVGQIITSTTDLEKDIKYKFEVEPKGWYLGIQYNF